jgi:hypothetical protein
MRELQASLKVHLNPGDIRDKCWCSLSQLRLEAAESKASDAEAVATRYRHQLQQQEGSTVAPAAGAASPLPDNAVVLEMGDAAILASKAERGAIEAALLQLLLPPAAAQRVLPLIKLLASAAAVAVLCERTWAIGSGRVSLLVTLAALHAVLIQQPRPGVTASAPVASPRKPPVISDSSLAPLLTGGELALGEITSILTRPTASATALTPTPAGTSSVAAPVEKLRSACLAACLTADLQNTITTIFSAAPSGGETEWHKVGPSIAALLSVPSAAQAGLTLDGACTACVTSLRAITNPATLSPYIAGTFTAVQSELSATSETLVSIESMRVSNAASLARAAGMQLC